jgi:lipid-A-disaccharide synthase-like uncharacterized protein
MNVFDRAGDWLAEHLTWLPDPIAGLALLPALGLATYLAVRWMVRWLAPELAQRILVPLVVGLIGTVGVLGLTVEFLATQLFRLIRHTPPAILYGAGDFIQGALIVLPTSVRAVGRSFGRLRRVHAIVLLAAVLALLGTWNAGYCDRNTTSNGCQSPVNAWTDAANELWKQVRR